MKIELVLEKRVEAGYLSLVVRKKDGKIVNAALSCFGETRAIHPDDLRLLCQLVTEACQ